MTRPAAGPPQAGGLLLGAHVPVAGGLACAPANGVAIGATAIQVFTRNHRQWACKPLSADEPAAFRAALAATGIGAVMAHASYLINLASVSADFLERSRQSLAEEVLRCHALGIPYVVVHPGAHLGAGEREGLAAIVRSLDDVHQRAPRVSVRVLLEVTAGQGSCLGHRFEHLAEILARAKKWKERDDRVEIIDKKVDDHGMLAITSIYIRYLLPMMIEIQWWDFKGMPRADEAAAK